jgi:hypothetical protein
MGRSYRMFREDVWRGRVLPKRSPRQMITTAKTVTDTGIAPYIFSRASLTSDSRMEL